MFSTSDTIVAIATPPGRGGIGVVRLSGPDSASIARELVALEQPLQPRRATFTTIRADLLDHVIATYFPAPHSYTGEDVVELSAHGSPVIMRAIVSAAMANGARLAEPGEFTLRAFLNGRIDLPQAEAVADLVDAVTPRQARAAFDQLQGTLTRAIGDIDAELFDLIARLEASVDFPEEGYHFVQRAELQSAIGHVLGRTSALLANARRGRLVREGMQIAIIGKPNVGKSSLFNVLAGADRAIVSDVPGTTRDMVTESIELDGLRVTLVDTAGRRPTMDIVEREGVARSEQAQATADVTVLVLDRSQSLDAIDADLLSQIIDNKGLVVINKTDMPAAWEQAPFADPVAVSAKTGAGVAELRRRIASILDHESISDEPMITNIRHVELVQRAHDALTRAFHAGSEDAALSEEFVLADLQDARAAFEEITGRRTSDDVLEHIFSRFCVGK